MKSKKQDTENGKELSALRKTAKAANGLIMAFGIGFGLCVLAAVIFIAVKLWPVIYPVIREIVRSRS